MPLLGHYGTLAIGVLFASNHFKNVGILCFMTLDPSPSTTFVCLYFLPDVELGRAVGSSRWFVRQTVQNGRLDSL